MQRHTLLLIGWICCVGFTQATRAEAEDDWSGKRVMVVNETAELKAGNEVISRARLGDVFEVDRVNEPWLWIKVRSGWINQRDVVLYDQAIEHFTAAINRNATAKTYHQRAIVYSTMGQYGKAVDDFDQAIERDRKNVGLYNQRGNALRKIGKLDRALADFDEVLRRKVRHPAVYTNRGLVWHDKGDYDRALADYNSAIGLGVKFAPAWEAGGSARQAKREYAKAINNFKQAITLDPKFDRAYNNLAWILATCPQEQFRNGAQAVKHATQACELVEFQDAGYLDTLAAAHAQAGQFEEAVHRAKAALELAEDSEKEPIAARVKLYEAGKPYRDQ